MYVLTVEYKEIQFEFQKTEKGPEKGFRNSLITMDPILIKFYPTSYQSLPKVYSGKRIENFGTKMVQFWVRETSVLEGAYSDAGVLAVAQLPPGMSTCWTDTIKTIGRRSYLEECLPLCVGIGPRGAASEGVICDISSFFTLFR